MTKTTYFDENNCQINEVEFFDRLFSGDCTVTAYTECLECGRHIQPCETCTCEMEE